MGYSMGSTIALGLIQRFPERFKTAVLGGFGLHDPATVDGERFAAADALTTPDPDSWPDQTMITFRKFLERSGQDVEALAALMRGQTMNEDLQAIQKVTLSTLLVCGEKDDFLAGAKRLAGIMPNAQLAIVPEADHMGAVMHQGYKDAVMAFLAKQTPVT